MHKFPESYKLELYHLVKFNVAPDPLKDLDAF